MCTRRCKAARIPAVAAGSGEDFADFDRDAPLAELASNLMAAHRADPSNALLAAQVRATLLALPGGGSGPDAEADAFMRELAMLGMPAYPDLREP